MDVGGDIAVNTTWGPTGNPPDTVYNLISHINILTGVTLTIQPGVKVKSNGSGFIVFGQLNAVGTSTSRITFTSARPVPAPQDWMGVSFDPSATDSSILDYCTIEYAWDGILNQSTPIRIEHSSIMHCWIGYSAGNKSVVRNNQFSDNVNIGIYCYNHSDSLGVELSGNVISNNPTGLDLYSSTTLPRFLSPNTFSGNTVGIKIESGDLHIIDDRPWNPATGGADCQMNSGIVISSTGRLTIAPGNTFKSNGSGFIVFGQLNAVGTSTSRITFTSARPVPAPQDWMGVSFDPSATDSSILDYCTIEYAWDGIGNQSAPLRIEHCDIKNNYRGINGQYIPSFIVINNRIFNNTQGISCATGTSPTITNNSIYNNSEYGIINNDNNYWINAENNWWGDSTGPRDTSSVDTLYNPFGLGNRVSDHVDYEPWLGYPIGIKEEKILPQEIPATAFALPSPNPFKNRISLAYSKNNNEQIKIKIFNCLGQVITTIENTGDNAGQRIIYWNGKDTRGKTVPTGVYWCQIKSDKPTVIKKIIKVE